jgi:hypothetical protein
MRYLCIVHIDPEIFGKLAPAEHRELSQACMAYDQELFRSGHLIAAEALAPPPTAMIVRVRGEKASVTDGPFIETKEHLGGFLFIEARDMNEAVEIAAKCPMSQMGSIEVRPQMTNRP